MKVSIRKIEQKEQEQVVIACVEITPEVRDIRAYALSRGTGLSGTSSSGHMEQINLQSVFYFEAVDEKEIVSVDLTATEVAVCVVSSATNQPVKLYSS